VIAAGVSETGWAFGAAVTTSGLGVTVAVDMDNLPLNLMNPNSCTFSVSGPLRRGKANRPISPLRSQTSHRPIGCR